MVTIAEDSNNAPRLLLVDANGKLILGNAGDVIGSVNEARGKTILYDRTDVTNGTATVRTVTAGKTYYLLQAALSYYATAGNKTALMFIGTSASILFRMNSTITPTYHTADRDTLIFVYPHPIPIAAGTAIQIDSSDAGLKADGWIMGWEE